MNQEQLKGGDRVMCIDPNHPRYHQSGNLFMMSVGWRDPITDVFHWDDPMITGVFWDGDHHATDWSQRQIDAIGRVP